MSVFGSGNYDRKKKVPVICLAGCAVVSVFASGGKLAFFLLWRESLITTGKKKFQSSVLLRPEKKKFQSSV